MWCPYNNELNTWDNKESSIVTQHHFFIRPFFILVAKMIIQRAYKVELKPNNKQKTYIEKSIGCARFAFN